MAAVVWHVTMSLDGFIAGPDDAMDWVFDYFSEESNETAGEVIETTGAILMGRHTYEGPTPATLLALPPAFRCGETPAHAGSNRERNNVGWRVARW